MVAMAGVAVSVGFGTFAATHGLPTDGAVQANNGWDWTTILNGGISAGGALATLVVVLKKVWPKSAEFIDGGLQVAEWLKKNGIKVPDGLITPDPVEPVYPEPPPPPPDNQTSGFLKVWEFVKTRGVEGKIQFVESGRLLTITSEPYAEPQLPATFTTSSPVSGPFNAAIKV